MRLFFLSIVFVVAASVATSAQRVERETADFIGSWRNIEGNNRQIARIDIRADYDNQLSIEVWSDCSGEECSLGRATGRLFVNRDDYARDEDRAAILFKFTRDRISGNILIRLNPRRNLVSHALIQLDNGSDIYRVERFERDDGRTADNNSSDDDDNAGQARRRPY